MNKLCGDVALPLFPLVAYPDDANLGVSDAIRTQDEMGVSYETSYPIVFQPSFHPIINQPFLPSNPS